ncbi:phage tail tip protein [Vibrio alginolyticus]|uniref:phage tail tip protein n=1 Tax=Vibrio alginolyticus TaxID=663 RepID=UPI0013038ECB|nr:hypothetical protein [Vibrio alginolyticus]
MGIAAGTWALIASIASAGVSLYVAMNTPSFDKGSDVGTSINKSGTSATRNPVYGTTLTGAVPVYNNVRDHHQEYLLNVFACGIGVTAIKQVYIDDVEVLGSGIGVNGLRETATDGHEQLLFSGDQLKNGFQKQCHVQLRAGLDTGVPMQLAIDNSDGEWTEAMRGDRVCAMSIRSKRIVDDEGVRILSDRFKVNLLVDGLPLYDPRYMNIGDKMFYNDLPNVPDEHRQTGRNPALAVLDYLTDDYYGMGIPMHYIDIDSFCQSATFCDYNRLHVDGQIDSSSPYADNLRAIADSANLSLFIEGGYITCRFEDLSLPVQDFDETNIINGTFKITEQTSSSYANVIEVEYKNTELNDEQDIFTIPEDTQTDPQIQSDGYIETSTISMPMTRYAGTQRNDSFSPMRFLANRELARNQYQKQVEFDIDLYETPVRIFDVITVTDDNLGWVEKEFRVTAIEKSVVDDRINIGHISCVEYADEIYLGTKNGGGVSSKPSNVALTPPTGLAFDLSDYTTHGYGTLSWSRTWFETEAEFIVDYKRSSDSTWTRLGRTKDSFWEISRLYPDSYDFRVATQSNMYGTSNFIVLSNQVISSLGTLPSVTGVTAKFDGVDCEFSWDDMMNAQVTGLYANQKLVREIFSHYRVSLYNVSNGESLIGTFTTSSNTFAWTYEQNVSAGATRNIKALVEIVAIDGSYSPVSDDSQVIANNEQIAVIASTNNYGRLGALWFNYSTSDESDWQGTEIHISKTSGFNPSVSTLAAVLGKQASWVWNFPENTADQEVRYVRLGHFDSFGRDGINYTAEEALHNSHIDNDATPFDDTDLQNQIAANDAVLAAHEAELGQHDARMDGHDSTLASHNLRMNDHDTTLAAHETTMSNLQSDLDAAEQAFSEQIPNVSNELSQLRNAANAPTLPSGTPIDTRINIVASPDKTETAAWGLFASNNGKSQFIVAADEFIVAGGNNGNAANDDVAFYFSNGQLLINNATIKNLTASNIAANAINSSHIAAGSIVASDIATGTITSTQLAANSVTASEIAADAVTASKIAANAITSSHIAAGSIVASDIATGTITATQLAANSVTASEIATNAVTANKIAVGSITAAKISSNAIETNHLSTGAITAAKISSGAITASKISADAINGSHVSASSDIVVGSGHDIVRLNGSDSTWRIAAGNASMSSSPFRVDKDGKMYATNAVVSGSVTATGGRISGSLYVGTGNNSSDYTVWYGNKHPNTNGESFRMVSDGKYRLRQWYNGRTIWYQNDGSSYFLDVNPAANTAKFYGTVQAEKIVGDIVSATAKDMNYRSSNASVSRYSWLNVTQVTISNSRPYDRTLIIEPMNIDSIFVTIYSNSDGQYDAIYRLVDENGTVFFESRIDNKFFTGSTPPYKASPSVRRVFASIPAYTPAGVLYLQFRCTSRDTLSTHIDYDGDRRLNHKLTAQLFQNSNEIH